MREIHRKFKSISSEFLIHKMSSAELIFLRDNLSAQHETMKFILASCYHSLFNSILQIGHNLIQGLTFTDISKCKITAEMCQSLNDSMHNFISSNQPITIEIKTKDFVLSELTKTNRKISASILKSIKATEIPCIIIGSSPNTYIDYTFDPICTDLSKLPQFEVNLYDSGIILRYPVISSPNSIMSFSQFQEKPETSLLQKICNDSRSSLSSHNINYLPDFKKSEFTSQFSNLISICESNHNSKLCEITAYLRSKFPSNRVITIAGPSSSNKTTFAKRLALQLNSEGFESLVIEMDDYFHSDDDIPYQPDGTQDWEHISALNVPLLAKRVHELLDGQEIPVRKFNFKKGIGEDHPELPRISLPKHAFLILEGIHGLNDILLDAFGRENVIPIFVTAVQPLPIDETHTFPLTMLRLIRRMVRDYNFRAIGPRATLLRWPSVRLGEEKNIFPFQHNAEAVFNSAYDYELPVLAKIVKPLLIEGLKPLPHEIADSPESLSVTNEGKRILRFLDFVGELPDTEIPSLSFLREFIGGSTLKY